MPNIIFILTYEEKMDSKETKAIFGLISKKYDLTNLTISLGLEFYWRKKFREFIDCGDRKILDACCGTGNSTFGVWQGNEHCKVYGIDFSKEMLAIARDKYKKFGRNLLFQYADATKLGFGDEYFDAVTIVFGIRNITDRKKALGEFYRVTKSGGKIVCMEFGIPENKGISLFYNFYLNFVLVNLGGLITGKRKAYRYLAESIRSFPVPEKFIGLMSESGWKDVSVLKLNFGICNIYAGYKR
ncbi:MAG: ubiquinone/menaquinone biosynthesis methyltransferase [Actinomycetota bacterium]